MTEKKHLKYKRILSLSLAFITALCLFFPCIDVRSEEAEVISESKEENAPTLNATHAIAIEATTGRVLYEKNAYEKTAMASTTKLMTALVTAETIDTETVATVSKKAASIGGSVADLTAGQKITVNDLLYCLMLRSGNDAAIAIAEAVGGTVEEFCVLMNEKAKELGALNTNFTSPHGLDNDLHYTTAYDLALICKAASENIIVNKVMGTKHYSMGNKLLINTNPFLNVTEGVTGGKTGFTNNAGRSIALTAERNGMSTILILIGCKDSKSRLSDGNKLLNYIYDSYEMTNLFERGEKVLVLTNKRNVLEDAPVVCGEDIILPLRDDEQEILRIYIDSEGKECPVNSVAETDNEFSKGDTAGFLIVTDSQNRVIYKAEVFADGDIVEKDFWYCLKKIVVCWFCGVL